MGLGPPCPLRRGRHGCWKDAHASARHWSRSALLGLVAAPALAAPGVAVSAVSSLKAGATAGTLRGTVVNDTEPRDARAGRRAGHAPRDAPPGRSGARRSHVAAHGSAAYRVAVKLPSRPEARQLLPVRLHGRPARARASSAAPRRRTRCSIKGGTAVRGAHAAAALAKAAQAETCSSGGRTLAKPGSAAVPGDGQHAATRARTPTSTSSTTRRRTCSCRHARRPASSARRSA